MRVHWNGRPVSASRIQARLLHITYEVLLRPLPLGIGKRVRAAWLRQTAARFGSGAWVGQNVFIMGVDRLELADRASVSRGCTLDARGGLSIGTTSMIGFETVIVTHTHKSDRLDVPVREQGMYSDPVRIGANVWIGARSTVLPGVEIGDNCIVGAGSVVTRSVPANTVVAGVPARPIRER